MTKLKIAFVHESKDTAYTDARVMSATGKVVHHKAHDSSDFPHYHTLKIKKTYRIDDFVTHYRPQTKAKLKRKRNRESADLFSLEFDDLTGSDTELDRFLDAIWSRPDRRKRPVVTYATLRRRETRSIERAIANGQRNITQLTDMVFMMRYPKRRERRLSPNEPGFQKLAAEWRAIRDKLIRPALRNLSITQGNGLISTHRAVRPD